MSTPSCRRHTLFIFPTESQILFILPPPNSVVATLTHPRAYISFVYFCLRKFFFFFFFVRIESKEFIEIRAQDVYFVICKLENGINIFFFIYLMRFRQIPRENFSIVVAVLCSIILHRCGRG